MNTLSKSLALGALLMTVAGTAARANEAVYEQVLQSVALVVAGDSRGSGSLVDEERRLVVTNYHVVGDVTDVQVVFPQRDENGAIITERRNYSDLDKLAVKGKVIDTDLRRDLALVELETIPEGVRALPLADESARPGQTVHSVGNPSASQALWIYSSGTVRQVYDKTATLDDTQSIDARIVETQSPLNKGDSGGPVVNERGELIAVVSFSTTDATLFSSCIEVSELRALLAGENKTVDPSIRNLLAQNGLKFTVDKQGLFVIDIPLADDKVQKVFLESETFTFGDVLMRHLWSPGLVSNDPLSSDIMSEMISQSSSFKIGSWEMRKIGDQFVAAFTAKVAADNDQVLTMAQAIAETAFEFRKKNAPQGTAEVAAIAASAAPPAQPAAQAAEQLPAQPAQTTAPAQAAKTPAPAQGGGAPAGQPQPNPAAPGVGAIAGQPNGPQQGGASPAAPGQGAAPAQGGPAQGAGSAPGGAVAGAPAQGAPIQGGAPAQGIPAQGAPAQGAPAVGGAPVTGSPAPGGGPAVASPSDQPVVVVPGGSLVGTWTSVLRNKHGEPVVMVMIVSEDGRIGFFAKDSCHIVLDVTGRYSFAGGVLRWTVGGPEKVATIQPIDGGRIKMFNPDLNLNMTFQRRG